MAQARRKTNVPGKGPGKGPGKVLPMPAPDRRRREDREVEAPAPIPAVPAAAQADELGPIPQRPWSIPTGTRCQEASMHSREKYIACAAPAEAIVNNRDARPYFMCGPCADHNVHNRGAKLLFALPKSIPAQREKAETTVWGPGGTAVTSTSGAVGTGLPGLGTPALNEWSRYAELKELAFGRLCEQRQRLDDEIKFREVNKKLLDEQIEAALAVAGVEKVTWEDRPVQIVHKSGSTKIVAEKLLEAGVPASTIAASTVTGNGYSYLLFGKAKKET